MLLDEYVEDHYTLQSFTFHLKPESFTWITYSYVIKNGPYNEFHRSKINLFLCLEYKTLLDYITRSIPGEKNEIYHNSQFKIYSLLLFFYLHILFPIDPYNRFI